MLASTCSRRLAILATVKFLSRLFTALNLLPSIATTARVNKPSWRHRTTNWAHTARIAAPLSRRKLAMVLKSGARRPVSHINSILRFAFQAAARLDAVEIAVEIDLQQGRGVVGGPSRRRRLNTFKAKRAQIQ